MNACKRPSCRRIYVTDNNVNSNISGLEDFKPITPRASLFGKHRALCYIYVGILKPSHYIVLVWDCSGLSIFDPNERSNFIRMLFKINGLDFQNETPAAKNQHKTNKQQNTKQQNEPTKQPKQKQTSKQQKCQMCTH